MGKLKTSKKAKNWRKGQSAGSNPSTRKFRSQVSRRGISGAGAGNLTVEAMAEHDEHVASSISVTEAGDAKSVASAGTLGTLHTEFTSGAYDGTPFESVQRLWNSPLASHREICAVLAALTEVIRDKNGNLTATEYFASLMTALETADGEDAITALAYLLSVIIADVPRSILQSKFSLCSKILLSKLSDASTSLMKSIVKCVGTLLVLQEKAAWSEASTVHIFQVVLTHALSAKPKVRMVANEVCWHVVEESASRVPSSEAAKSCLAWLDNQTGSDLFHVLALLKPLVVHFSQKHLKLTCEHLLKLLTQGDIHLNKSVMQVFSHIFSKPADNLAVELNAQLINALHDCQPSIQDSEPSCSWLYVMEKAHITLQKLNHQLCLTHLPHLFTKCLSYLLLPFPKSIQTATDVLKSLLENCIQPNVEAMASSKFLPKIFSIIESGLKYRYQSVWDKVLDIVRVAILVMGKFSHKMMAPKSLQSLCNLHETPGFTYAGELRAAVGAVFETMGPRVALEAVPLGFEEQEIQTEFPRAWLLLVMKNHVHHTELQYFTDTLLTLAARLRDKAVQLSSTGYLLEAKLYEQLHKQIWDILPGFCKCPTDLAKSFKGIAKVLGTALSSRPDLRTVICRSLSLLIERNRDNGENQAELSRFAQNYLPILFNIQTTDYKSPNPAVIACIKDYLSIADIKLVTSLFGKVGVKLVSPDSDIEAKLSVMDLAIAMASYVDAKGLAMLYKALQPLLTSENASLQKKSYKMVETVCSCENEQQKAFVASHLVAMRDMMLQTASSASAASKKMRMKCLSHLASKFTESQAEFVAVILPEVILCTKEVNEDTRASAYQLLVDFANMLSPDGGSDAKRDAVTNYFHMVLAGLAASSPHMLSATILALGRLVYEFRDVLSHDLIEKLLASMNVFLASNSREVVKSTLGFLKVTVYVLEVEKLVPHVQTVIDAVVSWSKDKSYHFRSKSKVLFERLIRKLGYEIVQKMVPESHLKLIVNIRKTNDRNKRLKSKGKMVDESQKPTQHRRYETLLYSSDDEGSDKEEETGRRIKGKVKRLKPAKTWIKETEDEPVDFLDQGVVRKVLASNPKRHSGTFRPRRNDFEITSDGKIVVEEEKETKEDDSQMTRSRKRKRSAIDDASGSEDGGDEGRAPPKRPAIGIHRRLDSKEKVKVEYGAEYRAKVLPSYQQANYTNSSLQKARGDVKIAGKADPYAYVRLDTAQLNRRKQAKLGGKFKGLMTAAKRGAQFGHKQRTKSKDKFNRMKKQKH
eukprot:m.6009 g.6009  ORF g.6009 m.6009 type:complete len:1265 (+) comp14703_c0_seq2:70-3864(+)